MTAATWDQGARGIVVYSPKHKDWRWFVKYNGKTRRIETAWHFAGARLWVAKSYANDFDSLKTLNRLTALGYVVKFREVVAS